MTRETKVGLLVGMGVILLIGIIVSDHLSMAQQQIPPDMTQYAPQAQTSLNADGTGLQSLPATNTASVPVAPSAPLPTPEQVQRPALASRQGRDVSPAVPPMADDQTHTTPAPTPTRLAQANRKPAIITLGPRRDFDDTPTFRQAALASSVPQTHVIASHDGPQPSIHYVQSGETLYAIAQRYYNDGNTWHVIRDANIGVVKADNTVQLGARLVIPNKALLPKLLNATPAVAAAINSGTTVPKAPSVVVKSGDTLSGLAAKYLGSSHRWQDLLKANSDQMDKATDLRVGMTLKLPGSVSAVVASHVANAQAPAVMSSVKSSLYVVQAGDTLSHIAKNRLGDTGQWNRIFEANRDQLNKPNGLKAGMKLKIPG